MFAPSELRLYRHAQDHRLLTLDFMGYPSLFEDILQVGEPQISKEQSPTLILYVATEYEQVLA